jgi:hypothetical protein
MHANNIVYQLPTFINFGNLRFTPNRKGKASRQGEDNKMQGI